MMKKLLRTPMNRLSVEIDKLVRERRREVLAVIRRFRKLSKGQQRSYGSAALFLIASLERAVKEKK